MSLTNPVESKNGQCCTCGYDGQEETPCLKRNTAKFNFDQTHCGHWWDGPDEQALADTEEGQVISAITDLEAAIDIAAAAEREACAKVAETVIADGSTEESSAGEYIAQAIRGRK